MKSNAKKKELHINQKVKYPGDADTCTIQLKKRRKPWWLLFLLLPLLLLIKCERSLTVYCYDAETNDPIKGVEVKLKYKYHYVFDDTGLFTEYDEVKKGVTDKEGLAKFDNIKCSLFCYLFHLNSEANVVAVSNCYDEADTLVAYHRHKRLELPLEQKTGLPICVIDKDTQEGIPGAKVKWRTDDGETGSIRVDDDGHGELPDVPACFGTMEWIEASADGYYDTIYRNVSVDVNEDGCLPIYMSREIDRPSTGDVQILLSWRDYNDLDLSCVDPYGERIYYGHRNSLSGGELDIDKNAYSDSNPSNTPIENIYWPTGGAPFGTYTVYVKFYEKKERNKNVSHYKVKVVYGNQTEWYEGDIRKSEGDVKICSFTLTASGLR